LENSLNKKKEREKKGGDICHQEGKESSLLPGRGEETELVQETSKGDSQGGKSAINRKGEKGRGGEGATSHSMTRRREGRRGSRERASLSIEKEKERRKDAYPPPARIKSDM